MAYTAISGIAPQYENYPNWWLKAYQQGTTTPLAMGLDPAGSTTVAKLELDLLGFINTDGNARVIPYVDAAYDMWLIPTEAEADASDLTNAIQVADNITLGDIISNAADIATNAADIATIEKQGITFYRSTESEYPVFARVIGSDGNLYKCLIANGTDTAAVDPVGDVTGTWLLSGQNEMLVTGTATFTNSTNNIALTGVGLLTGLEVGDVIQATGTASNNTEFTVEVITGDDNVIVNQAHAGGTTTKSLVNETVSCTITLLSKWYNASIGLGQGWATVAAQRSIGVTETNATGRSIEAAITVEAPSSNVDLDSFINGVQISTFRLTSDTGAPQAVSTFIIPSGDTYRVDAGGSDALAAWWELR